MESSWFYRLLSYLCDVHIESCSSDYNPELHILLSRGRYQLVTADAIYSHEDLYDNFSQILLKSLDLSSTEIKDVLILGLGLASIPIILDRLRPGGYNITAVEIDDTICQLAAEYAYPKIQSSIDTIIADAYSYVLDCDEQYDLICVDLFVGGQTPQKFRHQNFLNALARLQSDHGVIIYNTLAYTETDQAESKEFYNKAFKPAFPLSKMVYAHKNYMLISNCRWFS